MIIVKLQGGLGNQMFQYVVAKSIANGTKVYADLNFLRKYDESTADFTARQFELKIFKDLEINEATDLQLKYFFSQGWLFRMLRAFKPVVKIVQQDVKLPKLDKLPLNHSIYLDGYYQSAKYFDGQRSAILKSFAFPVMDVANEILKQKINSTLESISLHIRRGDYVNKSAVNNVHGVLPVTYYQKALDQLEETCGRLSVFVFSDDLNWAKSNLSRNQTDFTFVDNNDSEGWKDMALMACCKHHIVANSSFSWWGAWLSDTNGLTFAPRHWFNKQVEYKLNDIVPANWLVVDYD